MKETEKISYFVFQVQEESFAIPVSRVTNVLELMKPTRIPETPGYLEGIINVRGELLPVVDSRVKFGVGKEDPGVDACIIVLDIEAQHESFNLGLIVDKARDVMNIDESTIESVPDMGLNLNPEYVKGVINKREEIILILDIDKIFSEKQVTEIKQMKENQKD